MHFCFNAAEGGNILLVVFLRMEKEKLSNALPKGKFLKKFLLLVVANEYPETTKMEVPNSKIFSL